MINKICANIDKNHIYNCTSKTIGRQGENLCMQLEITLEECLCDSWVYLHFEKADGTTKVTPKLEIIDNKVIYDIGNDLLDIDGDLKVFVELHKESGLVWRSSIKTYTVLNSFNGIDQIENKEDFITEAQKTLDNMEELKEEVETGLTPTIGDNENWFICGVDTGKTSRGPKGDAYEITEEDYDVIENQVKDDIQPILDEVKENSETAISISKGANQCKTYGDYLTFIEAFNLIPKDKYKAGQDIRIVQVNVPDIWIAYIEEESIEYTYTTDEDFINELVTNGIVQVGYYKFGMLETQKVDLTEYVKNNDYATSSKAGIITFPTWSGLTVQGKNVWLKEATDDQIRKRTEPYIAVNCSKIDLAVKVGITDNKIELTEDEKTSACNWLGTAKQVDLTQDEYDALETKDENTYYNIVEE